MNFSEVHVPGPLARVVRRVTKPLYGGTEVEAITVGLVTFFLVPEPAPDLIAHEAFHRHQSRRERPTRWPWWLGGNLVGACIYGVKYFREYARHGYQENRYEREARVAAGQEEA